MGLKEQKYNPKRGKPNMIKMQVSVNAKTHRAFVELCKQHNRVPALVLRELVIRAVETVEIPEDPVNQTAEAVARREQVADREWMKEMTGNTGGKLRNPEMRPPEKQWRKKGETA
jgi:hypothetical protein